jgi:1-acyl-sn-glycerol-3-phosphate acyltransferase
MKTIAGLILKLLGWKITGSIPADVRKSVMIIAPHTSQWDFIIGRLAYWKLNLKARFLIKKEFFFFPLGYILRMFGALPVDRSKGFNIVTQSIDILNKFDDIVIIITPEGTRKRNDNWKKGFYFIAHKAEVPIIIGFLNYKDKIAGIGPSLYPSGNFEEDFKFIEDYYRKHAFARHPKRFNLQIL